MNMQALRARRMITMSGETASTGPQLWRPLTVHDDGLLVIQNGIVQYAGPFSTRHVPVGVAVQDLGAVTLVPAAVNAHTHIQLSHLAERTLWGQGFVPWLRSLIPLLAEPVEPATLLRMAQNMSVHTAHAGDYTSHGMALVAEAALAADLGCTLLAEWFGFAPAQEGVWPPRCRPVLDDVPASPLLAMAPAGHALYSTHEKYVRAAHSWCCERRVPFALNLAEFPEEEELLCSGTGDLVDVYRDVVLPEQWQVPGLSPVRLAHSWGLLGTQSLAVHCVHCDAVEIQMLTTTGTRVCLCPRSNAHLAVGTAPVRALAEAGVLLCLGTDGLTSNTDLNVWNDALALWEQEVLPPEALLRMLTSNGAQALCRNDVGALAPGKRARWTVLPAAWEPYVR